jgi:hypothetical protein
MELLYEEKGGLKKGKSFMIAMNFSWPLAKIQIYREKIILKYLFFKMEFFKPEIEKIEKTKVFRKLGEGVRFHHKKNYSKYIVFWSFNTNNLIKKLEETGYIVE